jgi:hypothetical protein
VESVPNYLLLGPMSLRPCPDRVASGLLCVCRCAYCFRFGMIADMVVVVVVMAVIKYAFVVVVYCLEML